LPIKIDLHLHTLYGSACAYMDPDQLIHQAKSMGLDGVCITEHNQIWGREALDRLTREHHFLVIGGVEVSTDLGEILVFGLHRSVLEVYSALELKRMVDEAKGAMIMAHPFRAEPELFGSEKTLTSHPSDQLLETLTLLKKRPVFSLVDALEVYNGRSGLKETAFTRTAAETLNLPGTGGSDAHAILGVGACYTLFEQSIREEGDLISQLKAGRFVGVDARWGNEGKIHETQR
jgi:predicted metal-dependent phosphoesterase TrpH